MMDRSSIILFHEGQILTFAANRTTVEAIEQARGAIDGSFNALLRLGTAEDAAGFAYACADRMVERVKEPTWPLGPPSELALPAPIAVPPPPLEPRPRQFGFWTIFAIGYGCAALPAAIIIANLVHR